MPNAPASGPWHSGHARARRRILARRRDGAARASAHGRRCGRVESRRAGVDAGHSAASRISGKRSARWNRCPRDRVAARQRAAGDARRRPTTGHLQCRQSARSAFACSACAFRRDRRLGQSSQDPLGVPASAAQPPTRPGRSGRDWQPRQGCHGAHENLCRDALRGAVESTGCLRAQLGRHHRFGGIRGGAPAAACGCRDSSVGPGGRAIAAATGAFRPRSQLDRRRGRASLPKPRNGRHLRCHRRRATQRALDFRTRGNANRGAGAA